MLWDGSSSYRMYVFKEFTRHCAINCKSRGRKEVKICFTTHWRTLVTGKPQKSLKIGKTAL